MGLTAHWFSMPRYLPLSLTPLAWLLVADARAVFVVWLVCQAWSNHPLMSVGPEKLVFQSADQVVVSNCFNGTAWKKSVMRLDATNYCPLLPSTGVEDTRCDLRDSRSLVGCPR